MSDKLLKAFDLSLQAAGIRAVTRTQVTVCFLLWGAIQAIAMGVYLATFETATLHASPLGEIYKVQMTGAAWLHSLPAVILVRAINTVDWLATLVVLSVGVLGMVRRAERAALMLVLFTLIDITFTNVPCSDPYDNGLWTIEGTLSTLHVEYAGFWRRRRITVDKLGGLDTVCVETRDGFLGRRTMTAEFRYRDGQSGRLRVSGLRVGVARSSFDGLQRELGVALKRAADRAGARYLEHPRGGCQRTPSPLTGGTIGHARRVWGSISGETRDPFHAAEGPFNRALVWWIGFLFIISRTRLAQTRAEARGGLGCFFVMGEGLIGGLLWAVILALIPARLVAIGLHQYVGDVHIPAIVMTRSIDATAVQLALLIAIVEMGSTAIAVQGSVSTTDGYPIGLPVTYYLSMALAWCLGWVNIGLWKRESTSFSASLRFFRPPELWHNWIQDTATFVFVLILAVPVCALVAEWRSASQRARRNAIAHAE